MPPTTNPSCSSPIRCHHCVWWYEVDDSEFPSRFLFDLAYQVLDGEIVIRSINPRSVSASDFRGNPLFEHPFTEMERPDVQRWFNRRLHSQRDRLTNQMSACIEQNRQDRSHSTIETFHDLARERSPAERTQRTEGTEGTEGQRRVPQDLSFNSQ